jgi:acetolactate synthase-1/3 small subunit
MAGGNLAQAAFFPLDLLVVRRIRWFFQANFLPIFASRAPAPLRIGPAFHAVSPVFDAVNPSFPASLSTPLPIRSPLMRHVLSATVQNVPGVLAHVSGMLASRGYNIDSLAVGETEDRRFSRMTFVLRGDDRVLDQVRRQLEKIVTVVRVDDISSRNYVERDLMLIKVAATAGSTRTEVKELAEVFRGRVVDVAADSVVVEISGTEKKIEGFIELMRPLGILELVRTGRIAMVRGSPPTRELTEAADGARPADEASVRESLA